MTAALFDKIAGHESMHALAEMALGDHPNRTARQLLEGARIEYIRALLYSPQVVVNRMAFWNNPLLVTSSLGADREGLVTLLARGVILPYLHREDSFGDDPGGPDCLELGKRAIRSLATDPDLADLTCVRFGGSDADSNQDRTETISERFRTELQRPRQVQQERVESIARSLLGGSRRASGASSALTMRLRELATWMDVKNQEAIAASAKPPSRNDVYRAFVTEGDPVQTPYRTDPFTFELKKWIDLIYNGILPWQLSARTFTPRGFPTPLDVGMDFAMAAKGSAGILAEDSPAVIDDSLERARAHATWTAYNNIQQQVAVPAPSPQELTHLDVVTIRKWAEWNTMMAAMADHLEEPFDIHHMDEFSRSYDEFVAKLGKWWVKDRKKEARRSYAAAVARVYRVGQWFVGIMQMGGFLFPILPPPGAPLPLPPGDVIRVVVESGLYLYQRTGVEWKRSQAARGMQKVVRMQREDLLRTARDIRQIWPELQDENYPGRDNLGKSAIEEDCTSE
ncbi:hypothetical protein AB0F30_34515 [Streptomyces sp. NPDC029006]|uniref:hypothetical protein n=1 Tax=Streptomyces sp. NPDC029006 TaxID=3155467 RepID=UPI0033EDE312